MKLLIITQRVDKRDSFLGFMHSWIEEFSKHVERLTVICLEKGEYAFSKEVKVLSLGKEAGASRIKYLKRFYSYIWNERSEYDTIFVHMNEEYVLLGAIFWKLWGKRILMWRNHPQSTIFTRLAVMLCDEVFCTSPDSYTAKFSKTRIMPTGINLDKFKSHTGSERVPRSLLSIGRIDRIKHIDVLIKALKLLDERGVEVSASIVGDPSPEDVSYYEEQKMLGMELVEKGKLAFKPAVPNTETPAMYHSHELFVNMTDSGSLDKTILSAMTSGALVVVSNTYFHGVLPETFIFKERDSADLADKIEQALSLPEADKKSIIAQMKAYVETHHSLEATIQQILKSI